MISVIMSVYRESKEWLVESIESILNQTLNDFEFIIILDNPKNHILKGLIENYAKKDSRIRFFINEKNIGLTASLNFALTKATGKYIARMDADDISELNRLEKQYNYMISNSVDILGSNIVEFLDEKHKKLSDLYCKNIDIRDNILKGNMLAHPTWFCKKEVYEILNGYRNMPACEDYDFILRAVKYGFVVENMEDYLLKYRLSSNSISRKGLLRQRMASVYLSNHYNELEIITCEDVTNYLERTIKNHKMETNYSKAYQYMYKYHFTDNIILKLYFLIKAVFISFTYFKINHLSKK